MSSEKKVQTAAAGAAAETSQPGNLLEQVIVETKIGRDDDQRRQSRSEILTLIDEVMKGTVTVSRGLEASINARIADIDELLSRQLNEIMHQADFQKLESSWRGLSFLVMSSETSVSLKIKVLNVSKDDLLRDFERSAEFDQSALFKKIYSEEYDVFGGAPFAAIIGEFIQLYHPGWDHHGGLPVVVSATFAARPTTPAPA